MRRRVGEVNDRGGDQRHRSSDAEEVTDADALPSPASFVSHVRLAFELSLDDIVGGLLELLYRHRAYLPGSPDPCQQRTRMIPEVTTSGRESRRLVRGAILW